MEKLSLQLDTPNGEFDFGPAAALISMCFEARNLAHKMHLSTSSYSEHLALQGFYEGIIPLVDTFAESFQGRYGKIDSYPAVTIEGSEPVGLMAEVRSVIDNTRNMCGTYSELQNNIDAIVDLCNITQYKLVNLR